MGFHWNKKTKKAFAIANAWNPIGWHYAADRVSKHFKIDPTSMRNALMKNLFGLGTNYSQYQNTASSYVPRTLSQLTGGN